MPKGRIFFCSQCTAVVSNEEDINDDLEVDCANCGEKVTCLTGTFDASEVEAFWKAYHNP